MSEPLYRPSKLFPFLESVGARPKKSLSQNFLVDGNILRKIADGISEGDFVLEIGPGPGALTEELLKRGAFVAAVEKDKTFASELKRLDPEGKKLTVFAEDILEFDFSRLSAKGKKWKVVANLPYQLTTPILVRLLSENALFQELTLMVQLEVGERFTADPGTKEWGSISLFIRFFSDPSFLFKVSRNCFFPKPNVDSAVIRFLLKAPPDVDGESFFKMTRHAFSKRRKMLRASLADLYPKERVLEALRASRISEEARPEELPLAEWLTLYRLLHK